MSSPVVFAIGRRGLYRQQEPCRILVSDRANQIVICNTVQIEYVCFSSQPPRPRRVRVRIRDKTETIELGKPPVHRGIRIAGPDWNSIPSYIYCLVWHTNARDDTTIGSPFFYMIGVFDH